MELINKILWIIAISLILTNSLYFSIKLKFPQLRIKMFLKAIQNTTNKEMISPKDTLIMTLSSKIGVGSLAGTALSIYYGGIGVIFWILISTFFLSIIAYVENALSIIYKKNSKSGPHYYIKNGMRKRILSSIYAITALILYAIFFSSIQNNTITTLINSLYNVNKMVISLVITFLASIVIFKDIKGISNVCNKIFPIMITTFLLTCLTIILINISLIPEILKKILIEAFNKNSISGGIIYTIIIAIQKSIFANETGVGTGAIISGTTENNDFILQGKMGLIQTYFINFIIIGMTSIVIALADLKGINVTNGIELTKAAFLYHLGTFGEISLLLVLVLFSFSTIITIYYYGENSLEFLIHSKKLTKYLKIITIIAIFTGGLINATMLWLIIDILLALLTIINMYAIYKLRKTVISKLYKR